MKIHKSHTGFHRGDTLTLSPELLLTVPEHTEIGIGLIFPIPSLTIRAHC